jgi:hypothetical protein
MNHFKGCDCGFGPPYTDSLSLRLMPTPNPYEEMITSEFDFRRRLSDLNVSTKEFGAILSDYKKARRIYIHNPKANKIKAISLLDQIINAYRFEGDGSKELVVEIWLYRFNSPNVNNSRVDCKISSIKRLKYGWRVNLFGAGMGHSQLLKIESGGKFKSIEGECKLITIKVVLMVEKVIMYKGDRKVGFGLNIEVVKDKTQAQQRVSKKIDMKYCIMDFPDEFTNIKIYDLKDIKHHNVKEYFEKEQKTTIRNLAIHIKEFGLTAVFKTEIENSQKTILEYKLPGGKEYWRLNLPNGEGIIWKIADRVI